MTKKQWLYKYYILTITSNVSIYSYHLKLLFLEEDNIQNTLFCLNTTLFLLLSKCPKHPCICKIILKDPPYLYKIKKSGKFGKCALGTSFPQTRQKDCRRKGISKLNMYNGGEKRVFHSKT